ncbi:hypothetical protein [Quadrisphaera sp. KR29]|uniref:hypothetical protein n=1 Tax=Quadrisphaera sp. KR29 TaxID=3461391 RepID=UPI004045032F
MSADPTLVSVVALVVAAVLVVITSVLREERVPSTGGTAWPGPLTLALGAAAAVAVVATAVRLLAAVS